MYLKTLFKQFGLLRYTWNHINK